MKSVIYIFTIEHAGTYARTILVMKYDDAPWPPCLGAEVLLPGWAKPIKVGRMILDARNGSLIVKLGNTSTSIPAERKQSLLAAGWTELPIKDGEAETETLESFDIGGVKVVLYP